MPTLECRGCGHLTNTAVSDHIDEKDGKARRCFMRWTEEGRGKRGCAYAQAWPYMRAWIDRELAKERRDGTTPRT